MCVLGARLWGGGGVSEERCLSVCRSVDSFGNVLGVFTGTATGHRTRQSTVIPLEHNLELHAPHGGGVTLNAVRVAPLWLCSKVATLS